MRKILWFAIGLAAGLAALSLAVRRDAKRATASAQADQRSAGPQYDAHGALIRPRGFETWVFVGSSTGLTYEPGTQSQGAGEFHDVYMRPESYRSYARTGKFPEKTMLVLLLYSPEEKVSPAKAGSFEGGLDGMAVSVKDHARFPDGWAYFNFGQTPNLQATAMANPTERCYTCHRQHAADDNVFVQFYPILRPIMAAHRGQPGH